MTPSDCTEINHRQNNCRQFTRNNRRVYECFNVTLATILPLPTATMILRIMNSTIPQLTSLVNSEIVTFVMNFCQLFYVSPEAFIFARNLRKLDLSHNLLKKLEFRRDSRLSIENLILSYNDLTAVPRMHSLQLLTHLDLSHNRIRYLTGDHLLLPKLEVVDLSYNQLHVVKPTDFGDMIRIVEIDGCPWRCDCHLRDFVAFQRKTLSAKSSWCYEPASIRGVRWDDISLEDFACGPVIAAPLEEIHKIREGDTVSFVCIVWGDPQPLVEWHKSNYSTQIYSDNDRILIETSLANNRTYHLMHIREITPQDESIYWCKASTGFFSTSKYFNLQVMEANTPNTVDNNPLSFLTNNKDYSLKSRDKFQKLLQSVQQQQQQQVKPIWQLMLLCLLSFAVVLFFVVCTICLVYWRQTQNNIINLVNNNELEKVIQPSTLMNEKVIESISNFEQLNSETSHSVSDQTPSVNVSYRSGQELARKAPLAQYDCDTCKLPLVQTSL